MTPLLEVTELRKHFTLRSGLFRKVGIVKAVDGVSFSIDAQQTYGLAGETGCGKSTVAKCVLRIMEPTSGEVKIEGRNIHAIKGNELKQTRRNIQAIFQNPFMSLDPRMTAASLIAEPLRTHRVLPKQKVSDRVLELMRTVGLDEEHASKYPHELSGGQNQRVAVARALALSPKLVVLDEPTSSLDVSVQAQILNLFTEIQKREGLSYLFISHDLSVLRYLTDVLSIMYLGRIVETGPSEEVFKNPSHPYTQLLLASVPEFTLTEAGFKVEVPDRIEAAGVPPENGCKFYPRCPYRMEKCKTNDPPLYKIGEKHLAACFLHENEPFAFYQEANN